MQGRTPHRSRSSSTRRVRAPQHQPWLVEALRPPGGEEDGGRGNAVPGQPEPPPLVLAWVATLGRPETRRAYLADVRGMLDHLAVASDAQLVGVRCHRVAAWRDHLAGELAAGRLSYQSCKRRMAAASSLYDHLNLEGHVSVNPLRRVKRVPRPEAERLRDRRRAGACPLSHCPALAGGPGGEATGGNAVPDLLARLAATSTAGRQLTLW